MNNKPLEQSGDAVLRGTLAALKRAAKRARARAQRTGTRVVVSRSGTIQYVDIRPARIAEPGASYGKDA